MSVNVSMTVNGKDVSAEVEERTLLVTLLREHLGLTGTHVGCDTSQCGACVVHVDGVAVKACMVPVEENMVVTSCDRAPALPVIDEQRQSVEPELNAAIERVEEHVFPHQGLGKSSEACCGSSANG